MKFLGIDFGWRSQPSGLCCLALENKTLHLIDLTRLAEVAAVLTWIDAQVAPQEPALIAVDAPTLIPNASGMRLPDRLAHKYFGRYHAGCYPANLGSPFATRTLDLGLRLEARGFAHAPTLTAQQPGRYQIEVFPHPATIHLFGLERILKYKKGRLAERRVELLKLRQYILDVLPTLEPALALSESLSTDLSTHSSHCSPLPDVPQTGSALKELEDKLDSLICAYVAAHWWYWGLERNLVLGDRTTGYIVVPDPFNKIQQN
jgi:predicted RNase H-like nuclease